ncbi:MAG: M20 family metallopeptidase [Actinomycetota bacterium]
MIQGPPDSALVADATGYVMGRRGELLALCGELVAARSDNPPGHTGGVADVVRSFLQRSGISVELVGVDPDAPNVVARVEGSASGPHLVMNAHADTIGPGEEAHWTVPPFEMTRRDGQLFGLGMGNMKGALAAMCLALAWLAEHRSLLRGPISLTVVPDEVVFGERGAAFLLQHRPDLYGDALLSGEGPGGMALAVAEKGVAWFELTAVGAARQSMLVKEGETPVARLARAILAVDALNRDESIPPAAIADLAFQAEALRVSANVGVVEAGGMPNQVASRAVALVDVRIPPGLSVASLEQRLREALGPRSGVAVRTLKGWDPTWTDPREPLARCLVDAAEAVRGAPPAPVVRLPASDAARWRRSGVPAVCFGPQPTAVAGVDDYALEDDVADCAAIYALAAAAFGGRASDA